MSKHRPENHDVVDSRNDDNEFAHLDEQYNMADSDKTLNKNYWYVLAALGLAGILTTSAIMFTQNDNNNNEPPQPEAIASPSEALTETEMVTTNPETVTEAPEEAEQTTADEGPYPGREPAQPTSSQVEQKPDVGSTLEPLAPIVTQNFDPNRYVPEGNPAPPNDELDTKVQRVLPILDSIVSNPKFGQAGLDDVTSRLAEHGLQPGTLLYNSFVQQQYLLNSDFVIASESAQPSVYATSTPGVYSVTYEVAAGALPNINGDDSAALRERMQNELKAQLNAASFIPLTFTVDFNNGVVETDRETWWAM